MKKGKHNITFKKMYNVFEVLPSIYFFRGNNGGGLFEKGTLVFGWLCWAITIDLKTFNTKEK